jgi:hypothetical protein
MDVDMDMYIYIYMDMDMDMDMDMPCKLTEHRLSSLPLQAPHRAIAGTRRSLLRNLTGHCKLLPCLPTATPTARAFCTPLPVLRSGHLLSKRFMVTFRRCTPTRLWRRPAACSKWHRSSTFWRWFHLTWALTPASQATSTTAHRGLHAPWRVLQAQCSGTACAATRTQAPPTSPCTPTLHLASPPTSQELLRLSYRRPGPRPAHLGASGASQPPPPPLPLAATCRSRPHSPLHLIILNTTCDSAISCRSTACAKHTTSCCACRPRCAQKARAPERCFRWNRFGP